MSAELRIALKKTAASIEEDSISDSSSAIYSTIAVVSGEHFGRKISVDDVFTTGAGIIYVGIALCSARTTLDYSAKILSVSS